MLACMFSMCFEVYRANGGTAAVEPELIEALHILLAFHSYELLTFN